jgi:hypothetical protein
MRHDAYSRRAAAKGHWVRHDRRAPAIREGMDYQCPTRSAAPPGRDASGHNATTSALCRSSITKCFGISKGHSAFTGVPPETARSEYAAIPARRLHRHVATVWLQPALTQYVARGLGAPSDDGGASATGAL